MKGTTPDGARTEREAAQWVRAMFARVARRYDQANHLLSFNMDRGWRARTVSRVREVLLQPGARVLDLCCGTGDLLIALQSAARRPLYGSDFCHPMLQTAARKSPDSSLFEADALQLPLADSSLDLITIAFGFRNLANYEAGLREVRRVLRRNGMLAILEFSQPPNAAFGALYSFYASRILPVVGGALSGARDAYTYLPESVRKFPSAEQLCSDLEAAGFRDSRYERMTGGIVALHTAKV
jgi:demethylmenaquinone methyltransferase/2-methoxy-6-polyprenyl-1,4-benzoquinol methylase